ncbi:hypothetical protein V7654_15800 [Bacillus sp. JJ1609]|uniref:hypothetical protein n=1 Tax=Bacillus sp. JJ1609 TaxID=3122977 RepID=UPI002FFFB5CA
MEPIIINNKQVNQAMFQFVFPFQIKKGQESKLINILKTQEFEHFRLDQLENENKYYGNYRVSHLELEQYYLPFTNKILFPHTEDEKGFQRFSKIFSRLYNLISCDIQIPFFIHSIDITVCPYHLGLLTIRTEIPGNIELSEAIEFASRFRILDKKTTKKETKVFIDHTESSFNDVETFIFDYLCPDLKQFFNRQNKNDAYFEALPFFEDEKMYVQSLIRVESDGKFDSIDAYRIVNLDGLNLKGESFVSSNNFNFIERFIQDNSYDRWAPNTLYVMQEHCFSCITNENEEVFSQLASQYYGKYYYAFILNMFHKNVLLKLANDYSEIDVEKDNDKIEKLIHSINSFTANYFFLELAAQSQSRQIFVQLRKMFLIENLYQDARDTLMTLYKYDEKFSEQKSNFLLLILTLYTVVGGIYGMNQVIEDLKGDIDWSKMLSYSLFEYMALFITISGLITAIYLAVHNFIKWRHDKRKREKWSAETSIYQKKIK